MKNFFLIISTILILASCSNNWEIKIPLENSWSVEISSEWINYTDENNDINVSTSGINWSVDGVGNINISTWVVDAGWIEISSWNINMSWMDIDSIINSAFQESMNFEEEVNISSSESSELNMITQDWNSMTQN